MTGEARGHTAPALVVQVWDELGWTPQHMQRWRWERASCVRVSTTPPRLATEIGEHEVDAG